MSLAQAGSRHRLKVNGSAMMSPPLRVLVD